jgi:hypothetical protein
VNTRPSAVVCGWGGGEDDEKQILWKGNSFCGRRRRWCVGATGHWSARFGHAPLSCFKPKLPRNLLLGWSDCRLNPDLGMTSAGGLTCLAIRLGGHPPHRWLSASVTVRRGKARASNTSVRNDLDKCLEGSRCALSCELRRVRIAHGKGATTYGYREHGPTIRRFAGGLFRAIWQSPGAHDLG